MENNVSKCDETKTCSKTKEKEKERNNLHSNTVNILSFTLPPQLTSNGNINKYGNENLDRKNCNNKETLKENNSVDKKDSNDTKITKIPVENINYSCLRGKTKSYKDTHSKLCKTTTCIVTPITTKIIVYTPNIETSTILNNNKSTIIITIPIAQKYEKANLFNEEKLFENIVNKYKEKNILNNYYERGKGKFKRIYDYLYDGRKFKEKR